MRILINKVKDRSFIFHCIESQSITPIKFATSNNFLSIDDTFWDFFLLILLTYTYEKERKYWNKVIRL